MSWLELSVEAEPEAVESVSELLASHGYNGGVAVEQPIIPGADGPEYTFDAERPVIVRTYLPLDEQAEDARARIEQGLWFLGMLRSVGPLKVRQLAEEDWANAWKQYYTIQRIGARSVVVPSWLDYQPQPDDVVLRLDPGMAFGTGLHPTTRLCVALLEEYVRPGMATLDLGSGSGILAVAAARLGANPILALDTDPIAVTATRENAERNDVAAVVTAAEGSLGAGAAFGHWLYPPQDPPSASDSAPEAPASARFELIVANIIAKVHIALAADYHAALVDDGVLLVSGIISEREPDVVTSFADAGLHLLERRQEGDWVALAYRRPAEDQRAA